MPASGKCVCVCVFVFMFITVCKCVRVYIWICVCVCSFMLMCVCVCLVRLCSCVCKCVRSLVCIHLTVCLCSLLPSPHVSYFLFFIPFLLLTSAYMTLWFDLTDWWVFCSDTRFHWLNTSVSLTGQPVILLCMAVFLSLCLFIYLFMNLLVCSLYPYY